MQVVGFTLSAEQVRAAPPEVRQWIANEIAAALAVATRAPQRPAHAAALAACTPQEALRLFEAIRSDFAACQVFLELARETPAGYATPPLHALGIGDILRHTRLGEPRLIESLTAINRLFQQLRDDPAATLFGFDQNGHLFIDETTHRSIRRLWETLVENRAAASEPQGGVEAPPEIGFSPPHLGPSEDIAAHHRL